LACPR